MRAELNMGSCPQQPVVESPAADAWQQRFIPDRLTPLRLTPAWEQLRPEERLRYNQLHGLYFHEQIIFFEQRIIVPLMRALQPHVADPELRRALDTFIAEEMTHSAGFHRWLRSVRPAWYAHDWRHFIRFGAIGDAALAAMIKRPRLFPCFLWLVQMLEERTMFASRLFLAEENTFSEALLALHRQHLTDEADHVRWDAALIAQFWTGAPSWLRRLNARLLHWMLGEFIAVPRRAAVSVIDALAAEIPNLTVPAAELKAQLRSLAQREDFRRAVFGRDAVPRTCKQASTAPDLRIVVENWLAHEHTP
jgi:hypothetical protein